MSTECGPEERHGQGRLAEMRDASGHSRLCYDRRGNLTAKHQRIDGRDLVTRYRYNVADRLMAVVYPSGFELQLSRDSLGRIANALLDTGSQTYPIVADLEHLPFGPVSAYPFADGSTLSKQWDLNYWPDAVTSNALDYDYSTDDVGNITGIASGIETNRQYDYDRLDRLSQVRDQNAALIESYAFDPTGNRTARTRDGATEQLSYNNTPAAPVFPTDPTYADFSHRLQSVDTTPRTYDEVGNTLTGIPELNTQNASSEYDERNRLTRIISGGIELARYEYNGRGERVAKQTAIEAYLYAFDESGQLIGRYVPEGVTDWRIDEEILWLDSTPIASVRLGNGQPVIRAIHSDHLNSPRALTSLHGDSQPQGTTVWRWPLTTGETNGNNAYGTEQALEDPDGDGTRVVFHLRFPGQQYEAESGLHYNYFRDYEAGTGRYVESDPIGLMGGVGTFIYAFGRPVHSFDPNGLTSVQFNYPNTHPPGAFCSIHDAVSDARERLRECSECDKWSDQLNLSKEDQTKLDAALASMIVYLPAAPDSERTRVACMTALRSSNLVYVPIRAFDSKSCPCGLASMFAHEATHLALGDVYTGQFEARPYGVECLCFGCTQACDEHSRYKHAEAGFYEW